MNPQSNRYTQLDFIKGICILLMIAFHLSHFSTAYPLVKQFVYTFHMPAFLIISGWLMNIRKPAPQFLHTLAKLAAPYLLFESAYILMAARLPIQEHISHLTPGIFLSHLFLHPIGPYWFLHTLLLCALSYRLALQLFPRSIAATVLWQLMVCYLLGELHLLSFACGCYFVAGTLLRQSRLSLTDVLRPTPLLLVPLIYLSFQPAFFHKETLGGIAIVYLVMSFCLLAEARLPGKLRAGVHYVGRQTLPIFLYSPLFTFAVKPLIPLLSFDSSRLLFAFLGTTLAVAGALGIQFVVDRLKQRFA